MSSYDRTGSTYSMTRRPDPRVAAAIDEALQGVTSVANIGAGTGSYETPHTIVAWHLRHKELLGTTHLDLGYRLIIADVS